MTRILVAGATGYLGRFVAKEFKERGDWVRALARNPDKLSTLGRSLEPPIADLVDEVFVGEVTRPETLPGLCKGIDVVFSSIGITRQTDGRSYMDVDYQGNKNLLDLALEASVRKFIFIHVFDAHLLQSLEVIKAKEKFIGDLRKSGMQYAIVCPTGLFNDMSEFLGMARKGTVYQIGDGQRTINPIHGADLAKRCVETVDGDQAEIPVGGPITYTYREIAEIAFAVLGKPPRVRRVPVWMARLLVLALGLVSRRYHDMAAGITTITQRNCVAPSIGTHSLKEFYEELAKTTFTATGRRSGGR